MRFPLNDAISSGRLMSGVSPITRDGSIGSFLGRRRRRHAATAMDFGDRIPHRRTAGNCKNSIHCNVHPTSPTIGGGRAYWPNKGASTLVQRLPGRSCKCQPQLARSLAHLITHYRKPSFCPATQATCALLQRAGYNLDRLSTGVGHRCNVVASSLIPRKAGDKVKTDRCDATMLAQSLRAGQLTEVWVPDEAHEAMRDLIRMRAQAMKDQRKTRQQLHSFLLRQAREYSGKHWTKAHRRWLGELKFAHRAQHLVLEELLAASQSDRGRAARLRRPSLFPGCPRSLCPGVGVHRRARDLSASVSRH